MSGVIGSGRAGRVGQPGVWVVETLPGRCPVPGHCTGGAQSRRVAPGPHQSAGSGWPPRHPEHGSPPRAVYMAKSVWRALPTPAQFSQTSPCLTIVSTRRMVSMCHLLVGANLEDIGHFSPSTDPPQIPPSLPPGHLPPHLSAASRIPEAQSARRSRGQDSRKP